MPKELSELGADRKVITTVNIDLSLKQTVEKKGLNMSQLVNELLQTHFLKEDDPEVLEKTIKADNEQLKQINVRRVMLNAELDDTERRLKENISKNTTKLREIGIGNQWAALMRIVGVELKTKDTSTVWEMYKDSMLQLRPEINFEGFALHAEKLKELASEV